MLLLNEATLNDNMPASKISQKMFVSSKFEKLQKLKVSHTLHAILSYKTD